MEVVLIHPSFNVLGGAEIYALNIARVLAELDFSVGIYTLDENNLKKYVNADELGVAVNYVNVKSLLRTNTFYDMVLNTYNFFKVIQSIASSSDLVINSKANENPVPADICVVHYPLGHVLYHWDRIVLGVGVDPKYTRGFWKLYIQPFRKWFYKLSDKGLKSCKVVITNSGWTADLLRKLVKIDSIVIYPPMDVEILKNEQNVRKSNIVVTISRFDPSKRLESVLYVAKRIPEVRFVIIGRVDDRSYSYYRHLRKLRERFNLGNVYMFPNLDEYRKRELLMRGKVYFHPTIGEHFGISVLEAISYGSIPVVHEFGGACSDIVKNIGVGYCYNNLAEAISYIENSLTNSLSSESMYYIRQRVIQDFSFDAFKYRWFKVLSKII